MVLALAFHGRDLFTPALLRVDSLLLGRFRHVFYGAYSCSTDQQLCGTGYVWYSQFHWELLYFTGQTSVVVLKLWGISAVPNRFCSIAYGARLVLVAGFVAALHAVPARHLIPLPGSS